MVAPPLPCPGSHPPLSILLSHCLAPPLIGLSPGVPMLSVISPRQPVSLHLWSLPILFPLPGMPLASQSVTLSGPGTNSPSSLKSSQISCPNLISYPHQCSHSFVLGIKARMGKHRSQVGGKRKKRVCIYVGGGGERRVELFRALLPQKVLMSPPVCPRGAWQEKVLSLRKNPVCWVLR